jgi:hypothetical protein
MMTLPATYWNIHDPINGMLVDPKTPLWVVTKGSRGPFAHIAEDMDWKWEHDEPSHVLAWALLIESKSFYDTK